MRALAFLLGARALDAADAANPTIAHEPTLPPLATLPEGAAAWRRWAEAGRAAETPPHVGRVEKSNRRPTPASPQPG